MGMEIHAAMAVLHTLNTKLFYIDLNNHLILYFSFSLVSSFHFVSRDDWILLQISVVQMNETLHKSILIYWNNPCQLQTSL